VTLDIDRYRQRFGYSGALRPDLPTLRALHVAHLLAVPFENLDIHLGRPIVLDEQSLFDKIVRKRRGGFCYELNGLFAGLLRQIGFPVTLLAAGVINDRGEFDPPFDHLALLVSLDERWLVDVGFGDSFRQPLRLDERGEQRQGDQAYRLVEDGDWRVYQRRDPGGDWLNQYRFTLDGYRLADYEPMCRYHQTSPNSPFTRRRVCSLATLEGRITLSDRRFITTTGQQRHERLLASDDEYLAVLRSAFGIDLDRAPFTEPSINN
jgi:N-hydroxyarylamine O-acetyltransferase